MEISHPGIDYKWMSGAIITVPQVHILMKDYAFARFAPAGSRWISEGSRTGKVVLQNHPFGVLRINSPSPNNCFSDQTSSQLGLFFKACIQ
jgi:hypothetical protein